MSNVKLFVAEFVGTFALVFVGVAAGLYGSSIGLLGIALAQGLTLAAFVYIYDNVSYFNPAVTLGLALNGAIDWVKAAIYLVAQFVGAILAALLLHTLIVLISPTAFSNAASSGLLTDATKYPFYYALGLEALLTFFLVTSVLHVTAEDSKAGQFAGLVIGLTLAVAIMAGNPLSGASMNPARSFGTAIFTSVLDTAKPDYQNPMLYMIYFVGPLIGSVAAVLLYQLFKPEFVLDEDEIDDIDDVEEVEVVEIVEEEVVEEPEEEPVKQKARKTTKK